jgi:hypothetical protein
MRLFRLLTATALILSAASGVRADPASDLDGCLSKLRRNDFDGAIALCTQALASGRLSKLDQATAEALRHSAQAEKRLSELPLQFSEGMVIDPASRMSRGSDLLDDAMVINPEALRPGLGFP